MSASTDYAVENQRGVILRTFDSPALAHRWADEHAGEHVGLAVFAVTTTVTRRRVDARGRYAPRVPTHHTGELHDQG